MREDKLAIYYKEAGKTEFSLDKNFVSSPAANRRFHSWRDVPAVTVRLENIDTGSIIEEFTTK